MKKFASIVAAMALLGSAFAAQAASTSKTPTAAEVAHWKKVKTCNAKVKGLKGKSRDHAMRACLAQK